MGEGRREWICLLQCLTFQGCVLVAQTHCWDRREHQTGGSICKCHFCRTLRQFRCSCSIIGILFLIYLCIREVSLYSTEIITRATPLSKEKYGWRRTRASAALARKVAEEKEWSSPLMNHSIPPAQGFWSQLKAEQLLSILYDDHRCASCITCFCSSFTS